MSFGECQVSGGERTESRPQLAPLPTTLKADSSTCLCLCSTKVVPRFDPMKATKKTHTRVKYLKIELAVLAFPSISVRATTGFKLRGVSGGVDTQQVLLL